MWNLLPAFMLSGILEKGRGGGGGGVYIYIYI